MPFRVDPRIAWQVVGEEVILLDVVSGTARGLNPVASYIWPRLERESPAEICAGLRREFAVDEETAIRDLAVFVDELRSKGFLQETP